MSRIVWAFLIFLAGTTANAAEKPAVEVRVRAAADMLDVIDYLIKLLPNDEKWQQYLKMAKTFAESKNGFLGLDPKKPIGAYVGIAAEVEDSPVVLMVPVAVEADFLALLKTFLKLDYKKLDGGLYSFVIPNIPAGPGFFRFADGYAFVTIRSSKSIAPDKIIRPADFFAEKQIDIVSATVRIDRFPADIRKAILGQIELDWHEALAIKSECPFCQAARKLIVDWAAGTLKTILGQGQSLDFALKIDPKADTISTQLKLTPRTGTALAKYLKDAGTGEAYTIEMTAKGKDIAPRRLPAAISR